MAPSPLRSRARALGVFAVLAVLVCALFVQCMTSMPGASYAGAFVPLEADLSGLRARLERHVDVLAAEIGPRNGSYPAALERAALYVEEQLGPGTLRHEYEVGEQRFRNLELEVRGTTHPDEIVVVGAHYDSCYDTPGADDNASGVAAMLELARNLRETGAAARTVRFVGFASEEPPHFGTSNMGSRRYARRCRERGENVVAMFSLETLGYYSEAPRSQSYPVVIGLFYPHTGNFIAFVGNMSSRKLVRRSVEVFRAEAEFPCEGLAAPSFLPGVWWSDHWSFWLEGYAGVMVTDTAPYRNPHYHRVGDVPAELDFPRLTRVTAGLRSVLAAVAGADEP